jgi:hypothetical protein
LISGNRASIQSAAEVRAPFPASNRAKSPSLS